MTEERRVTNFAFGLARLQVAWVGSVENGRFAHLALPPTMDGLSLMKLSTQRLSQVRRGACRAQREITGNRGKAPTMTSDCV